MIISSQRALFDIPRDITYFNCAYMSPLLRAAVAAGTRGLERKARPWSISAADFFSESDEARQRFAALINADHTGIAIVPSASYALSVAARNIPIPQGGEIVLLAEQFPSNVYPWRNASDAQKGRIVAVDRPCDNDWTAAVCTAITPRTAVAALPHCHWTDGSLINLETVRARCDEVGAALVVDATQSAGALAFDVNAVRPDFVACAAYKWLLGPYSLGFLYAAPHRRDGAPIEHGWITRGGSENFSTLLDYRDDFQPGAQRYDMGERANFALLPAAIAALDQLLAWGVDNIQTTLTQMTTDIAERAADIGLTSVAKASRAGHFLGLSFPNGAPPAGLLERLANAGVYVSVRGHSMRVTPHLYNTEEDVGRLMDALKSAI
ncbi:MAG: aminotransferase class V-fold PLP-dependent enzyme [Gammaproteobacteria bacterium]|nr:aminotransferase class V-fold PLP-dependent enzyme [Gammaproteobacteria bacterium]